MHHPHNNTFHTQRSILKNPSSHRNVLTAKVFRKKINVSFNEANLYATQRILLPDRTYGFLKTDNEIARTPYPKKTTGVDSKTLAARLRNKANVQHDSSDSFTDSVSEVNQQQKHFLPSLAFSSSSSNFEKTDKKLNFLKHRKDFDYAEYTITLGIKMSDIVHPPIKILNKPGSHVSVSDEFNLETIKEYCHNLNIRILQH